MAILCWEQDGLAVPLDGEEAAIQVDEAGGEEVQYTQETENLGTTNLGNPVTSFAGSAITQGALTIKLTPSQIANF